NHEHVRVIHHKVNKGYGGALRTGFAQARKRYVFYTDGDAQYDVCELENLVEKLTPDVDVVNGYKIKRNDPYYRVVIGRIYQHVSRLLFSLPIRDVDCDFRLIRRDLFDRIELFSTSGTICVELIYKLAHSGVRFSEVPVSHYFRASGKSQFFNFRRLFRVAIDYSALWFKLVVLKREHMHAES
ncbi:glycosyltransferase family 2 protein, partial [candidate division KSB1 bacterium]|nr:glycosyltransferase family 2 protein [candidate division KSB1 bacterium]